MVLQGEKMMTKMRTNDSDHLVRSRLETVLVAWNLNRTDHSRGDQDAGQKCNRTTTGLAT